MSVRMALAKLCACTAGGAILGGGAVHVAENPPERPAFVHHSKVAAAPRVAVRTVKRVRRGVRTAAGGRPPGRPGRPPGRGGPPAGPPGRPPALRLPPRADGAAPADRGGERRRLPAPDHRRRLG